jgi:hypothetical protein
VSDHEPAWLKLYLDDSSVFPPVSVSLDGAVAAYRAHQRSSYAGLLGNLVVPDVKIAELIDVLDERDEPLAISLLVTGGAGSIAPAVRWASRAALVDLRAIECALRNEEDLVHNARRFVAALDAVDEDLSEIPTYVELPSVLDEPTSGWLSALDEIAAAGLRTKFRTGGTTAEAFPTPAALSTCFNAALDRELRFKCTGGLERALSWSDETGVVHYGFINLLVGTRSALDGEDVASALTEPSADVLLAGRDLDALDRARRWLCGVGTPDLLESHDDIVDIGLITPE